MRKLFFYGPFLVAVVVVFLLVLSVSLAQGEAILLPAGTTLTLPGKIPTTLAASHFMLERSDMEVVTVCLQERVINNKVIEDLKKLSDKQAAQLSRATMWSIVSITVAVTGGFFLGHATR